MVSQSARYNVKCPENRELSFSIQDHRLEERKNCTLSGNNQCVDSLNLYYVTYGGVVNTTCGSTEVEIGEVKQDGMQELSVEFITNREHEYPGFEIHVWCVDPGSPHPSESGKRSLGCTAPPRNDVDSAKYDTDLVTTAVRLLPIQL